MTHRQWKRSWEKRWKYSQPLEGRNIPTSMNLRWDDINFYNMSLLQHKHSPTVNLDLIKFNILLGKRFISQDCKAWSDNTSYNTKIFLHTERASRLLYCSSIRDNHMNQLIKSLKTPIGYWYTQKFITVKHFKGNLILNQKCLRKYNAWIQILNLKISRSQCWAPNVSDFIISPPLSYPVSICIHELYIISYQPPSNVFY